MSKTFIPIYLELSACSVSQAKAAKATVQKLLSDALVTTMLQAQGVPYRTITVCDPVDEKGNSV